MENVALFCPDEGLPCVFAGRREAEESSCDLKGKKSEDPRPRRDQLFDFTWTKTFLFGASDRMLPRFSAWFSSRISFKMWQWRNRYNFILQQERRRSFLRGWIIESRLLEPFGESKWRFAAVETPGSSSVVIWNNSVWLCGIHTDFHLNEAYFRQQRVIIWNICTDGGDSQTETKTVLITDVYVQYFYFLKHKDLFILFFNDFGADAEQKSKFSACFLL